MLSRLAHQIQVQFRAGSEFLYPSICQTCAERLPQHHSWKLCQQCLTLLCPAGMSQCRRCAAAVGPNLETTAGCIHCKNDQYAFENVTGLGNYHGLLQAAILNGKSAHDSTLLRTLATLLFSHAEQQLTNASTDLIIPIPHHWTDRVLSRSQASTTIGVQLAELLKVPVDRHILLKRKRTPKQHSLTPTERRQNLRAAFSTRRGVDLTGAKVLLVDDVLTTGTTCQRATRVLAQAGAEEVRVAVLARGIGA